MEVFVGEEWGKRSLEDSPNHFDNPFHEMAGRDDEVQGCSLCLPTPQLNFPLLLRQHIFKRVNLGSRH